MNSSARVTAACPLERGLLVAAGMLFIMAWGLSLTLFPLYKGLALGYVPVAAGMLTGLAVSAIRPSLTRRLQGSSSMAFAFGVSTVGLVLRVAACLYFPLEPANDHEMFYLLAVNLAAGHGYTWGAGPTGFFPPGLPLLLTAFFIPFGPSHLLAKLIGLAIGASLVPISYLFARRLTSEAIARWTAVLVAFSPTLVFYSATVGYEPLLAAVVLGWAFLTHSLTEARSEGRWRVPALGVLSGVGTLIKPVCIALPLLSLIVWLLRIRPAQALWRALVLTALMLAVIVPWTMRNWRALGHPVLVSTNGGVVLYSANNADSLGIATPVRPLPGEVDEVSRDRLRRQAAIRWIVANPGPWLKLAVAKAAYGWGTSSSIMSFVSADRLPPLQEDLSKAALNVGWGALFVWCALAAWRTRIWAHRSLTPALLFLLYLFAVHLVYEALSRHHITVLPVLCLTAAAWLASPKGRKTEG